MVIDFIKGLVTFADILGWKGIWQKQDTNPIDRITQVKDEIINFGKKQAIIGLYNIFRENYNALPAQDITKLPHKFDPLENALECLQVTGRDNGTLRAKLENLRSENMVTHSIDLISDTFIICTTSLNKQEEIRAHGMINKVLIETCLKNGLLIRGATSYGNYFKEGAIFTGPAIDDAASWHELGHEIAIFLSPSALLNFEEELKEEELNESTLYMHREVKLKNNKIKTYCVKWDDSQELFKKISQRESPMHPEIADKYLNTLEYLKSCKERQLKKETERPYKTDY